ncbi:hypothetical protein WJX81_001055 [Elliptochloris bilobata]|uniref:Fungal lipase-type domain-containing protein n=1 Tax=Elliptochloris bilobata TaxID=381761 RepID=A0AAW1S0L2_9CHLO
MAELSAHLSQAATEGAFDLAPLQTDEGLLRTAIVLAELCHFAYVARASDIGSSTQIEVPLQSGRTAVAATLIHFRESGLEADDEDAHLADDAVQQFGVWEVAGLGLAVAFRGTACLDDVVIDTNIAPVPLGNPPGRRPLHVHRGFHAGVVRHLDEIVAAVRARDAAAGKRLPVWVAGHSLGGGYANCLALHLLASRSTAELFGAGGGAVTFGAPMVLHAADPDALFQRLRALEAAAEATGGGAGGRAVLQFHNFVNNADVVPRLLGTSLDAVHAFLAAYVPGLAAVHATARDYRPFGSYHFVLGESIRSPLHTSAPPTGLGLGRVRQQRAGRRRNAP